MPPPAMGKPRAPRPAALPSPPVFAHVVCLSGAPGEAAIAESHATLLARANRADLTVYHVEEFNTGGNGTMDIRRIPEDGVRTERHVVERGMPTAATLAAAARRLAADLVVMAPREHGALARVLGFSLTEATVDRLSATVPVLCARGEARPYRQILVATDFSATSRRSFRLAARLAGLFGSAVTVLHAAAGTAARDGALASLRRFVPHELAHRAPHVMVEAGEPCAAILSAARTVAADLIVLSTHGRDSLGDALLGTHAQRVIRQAACPVLVS